MHPTEAQGRARARLAFAGSVAALLLVASCATSQSRFTPLGDAYPARSGTHEVEILRDREPTRPHVRVARLDVHLEKTHFIGSGFEDAKPELLRQARLSGADAIIEIKETRSTVLETRVYHVTAIGIRYTDRP